MNPSSLLKTASTLATQAGSRILELLNQPQHQERKADDSIVTQADFDSDEMIREGLLNVFPGHGILTEEAGLLGKTDSEWIWVVDPLDGTKAYAKGIPGFCVMIGLLHHEKPYLGVVYDPLEDFLYEAVRGEGCFLTHKGERKRLQVSSRQIFSEMPLVISTGFPEEKLKRLQQHFTGPLLAPINSVGIKVGLLVREQGDIYLNHHGVSYWDTCAPQVILEEAGGTFTGSDGQVITYSFSEPYRHEFCTVASNGVRHEEILKHLKDLL